jgi:hypothetical protein
MTPAEIKSYEYYQSVRSKMDEACFNYNLEVLKQYLDKILEMKITQEDRNGKREEVPVSIQFKCRNDKDLNKVITINSNERLPFVIPERHFLTKDQIPF